MTIARPYRATSLKTLSGVSTALLLLFSLSVSAAELYRWTDSRGVTHFTDKPPKGVNAERVTAKRANSLSNPSIAAEEPAEAAAPESDRCRVERERLAVLQSNSRIHMEGRDGTKRELSAEEIQHEISLSERAIDRFCKPATPAAN